MFMALLICSDGECAELFEAYGSLEELQALACDCGCTLEVVTLQETADSERGFELVPVG